MTQTSRFLASVRREADTELPSLPWSRGTARQAMVARREKDEDKDAPKRA